MDVSGVILAAGRGERFGGQENKALALLCGRPLLYHSLVAFARAGVVDELVVVARPGEEPLVEGALAEVPLPGRVVRGGERRQDSARAGVLAASGELVLIHDAARPLVSPELIRRVVAAARKHGAVVPILPVVDTIRRVDGRGFLKAGQVPREGLVRIQTPQGFRRELILSAYAQAEKRSFLLSDDAAAVLAMGRPVAAVPGDPRNLKITYPEDLALAEGLLGG